MSFITIDFMSTSAQHQLVIEVGKDFFAFGIKDTHSQSFTRFESCKINSLAPIDAQLDQIFSEHNWLLASYEDILVLHNNDINSFVPQLMFDETLMGSYLQYSVKIYSTDFFDYDECLDMRNVYVPYVNYNNYLIEKLGTFSYQHISTVLLNYIFNNQEDTKEGIYVCLNQNSALFCVVEEGKFRLYNRFSTPNKEDFIYYTLFIYEQLKMDRLQTPLFLMGEIAEDSDFYQLASEFIQNLSIIEHKNDTSLDSSIIKTHFLTLQA